MYRAAKLRAIAHRVWLVGIATFALAGPAVAQDDPEEPSSARRVAEVLRSMSDLLAAAPHFRFRVAVAFDQLTSWGQKVQLSGQATVGLRRPNGISIEFSDDVSGRSLWYDGEQVTLLDSRRGFYAQRPAPPDIDATVDALERRLGLTLPLVELLESDPYAALTDGVLNAAYLGVHTAYGVPCHHLALMREDIDWQIWIELGDRPVPRKLVIDRKHQPGEPQYAGVITDWDFETPPNDEDFQASLPEDAVQIEFIERIAEERP